MSRLRGIVAWTLVIGGAAAGPAQGGGLTTYVFDGTIGHVNDPTGVFDRSIHVGSPFSLTVTLPTDAPNTRGVGNPASGSYALPGGTPGEGVSLSVNGQPLDLGVSSPGRVDVSTVPGVGDAFSAIQEFKSSATAATPAFGLQFHLSSQIQHLSGPALPGSVDLADFAGGHSFGLVDFSYNDVLFNEKYHIPYPSIDGQFTSAQVIVDPTAIPEPATGLIFGVGVAGYLCHRRRSRGQSA